MKTSIKIGRLLGIPIKIHFTFIFILALFAWAFTIETISILGFTIGFGGLPVSLGIQSLLGIVTAIFLFICVLLHELGHSYVTQRYGVKIKSITLFIFGGVSQSEEIPQQPNKEMKIAIAGPLVSIALGAFFYVLYVLLAPYATSLFTNSIYIVLGTLAFYNLLLAGFNLIPAFPIDGGRVLRAAFAMRMNYQKATKTAAAIGKGVAVAMAVFGFFFNIWLVLIAIFIFFGASQEGKTLQISEALKGKQVKDVMNNHFESVSPETSVQTLYNVIEQHRQFSFPVMRDDTLVGTVSLRDVKRIDKTKWEHAEVNDIMNTDVSAVSPDEDTFSVFKKLVKKNLEQFVVKDDDTVVGIISRNDIAQTIQISDVKNV